VSCGPFRSVCAVGALTACASGCKKPPDDKTLAQGEWTVVAVDFPESAPADERQEDALKDVAVVVQGDRVTITHPKEKESIAASFTLDPMKTPKELDITDVTVSGGGEEEQKSAHTRGIYKFEGDELVLALTLGNGKDFPRPTEFSPSADKANRRGVFVFHLKKK
jgi:uncharacterized protein (TIGR03067 family)